MSLIAPLPTQLVTMTAQGVAGNTVSSTTSETAFAFTWTLAANTLTKKGQVIQCRFGGQFSTTITAPTLRGKIKVNGVTVIDTQPISALVANASNLPWQGTCDFTLLSDPGQTATMMASLDLGFFIMANNRFPIALVNQNITIDTTADAVFSKTAQWSSANANNSITLMWDYATLGRN